MKKQNDTEVEAQGAETSTPSRDQIRQYLKRDFQSAYTLLDAIAKEDPLLDMLTDYVYSNIVTRKNKETNPVN